MRRDPKLMSREELLVEMKKIQSQRAKTLSRRVHTQLNTPNTPNEKRDSHGHIARAVADELALQHAGITTIIFPSEYLEDILTTCKEMCRDLTKRGVTQCINRLDETLAEIITPTQYRLLQSTPNGIQIIFNMQFGG